MNAQDRNKALKVQKVQGVVLKGAFAICEVENNLINLKNNKEISVKDLRLQLSNVIRIYIESVTFLGIANLEVTTLEGNTYLKFYHQSWSVLPKMSLRHQNSVR